MICPRCGSSIPEGMLVCPDCGHEIQMVPDYNPMDDVLAREIEDQGARRRSAYAARQKAQAAREAELARKRRARQAEKKKRKKQRRTLVSLLLLLFVLIGILVFVLYRGSYAGLVSRGKNAYKNGDYKQAETLLNRAIDMHEDKSDAYNAIYKVYIAQDQADKAEDMLLDIVAKYPKEVSLYKALFSFYRDSKQSSKIAIVLDTIEDDSVRAKLKDYDVAVPTVSLEEGEYDDVQQVSLEAPGAKDIYYTTDGSVPTKEGKRYINPVQISEGETILQAIAVNKKGIESLPVSFTYNVELPIADAPAVTPSTGQYTGAQQITVQVPDGYTAYYTMDGTEPTAASEKYNGPIQMPEGNTLFSVVLMSPDGKFSDITKRNYERL